MFFILFWLFLFIYLFISKNLKVHTIILTNNMTKGSAQKAEHNIYIWNRTYGQLLKILEGPKEGIMDLMVR